MRTFSGEDLEVEESSLGNRIILARVKIRERLGSGVNLKANAFLTADELAAHARECLAVAESMRERARVKEERLKETRKDSE